MLALSPPIYALWLLCFSPKTRRAVSRVWLLSFCRQLSRMWLLYPLIYTTVIVVSTATRLQVRVWFLVVSAELGVVSVGADQAGYLYLCLVRPLAASQ